MRRLEEQFKVHISSRREGVFVVSGEEANVTQCAGEIADMLDETSAEAKLEPMELYALMEHKAKYLHQIEDQFRVHLAVSKEQVTIRGGKKAVARAERALSDLFRSSAIPVASRVESSTVELTPFMRSLLIADKMKRFAALRESCPAYLSMGKGLETVTVLGTPQDQRESVATIQAFVASHVEVKEEKEVTEAFVTYLLEKKGARIQEAEKQSGAHLRLDRQKKCVAISGLKSENQHIITHREQVEKAREVLEAQEKELAGAMVEIPISGVQLDALMENKAAMLVALREEQKCMVELDRAKKVLKVVATEEQCAAIEKRLADIAEERIAIPARVRGVFVGAGGKHIASIRDEFKVVLSFDRVADEEVLSVGGAAESVAAAKKAIEAWLEEHTVLELRTEPSLAFQCIVGVKGATKKELQKELKVEIHVESDGCVWVLGAKALCEAAMARLEAMLEAYKKENAVVEASEQAFRNAPELRFSEVEKEAKALEVEVRCLAKSHSFAIHGAEEKVAAMKSWLEALLAKYADYDEVEVEVPAEQIGTLLGKGGEHVRELQTRLNVTILVRKQDVTLWGPASALEAAREGVLKDLEERVIVTKEVNCTVKQVQYLLNDHNEVRSAIEKETGATIRIPRDLPAIGPTRITLRGNAREVKEAQPLVSEALQGLVRDVLRFDEDELTRVLHESDLQVQRLALESRCRIKSDEAAKEMSVVGPKEGVLLVRQRVWEQLSKLEPERYEVVAIDECTRLGLAEMEKKMAKYCEEHACSVRVAGHSVLVHASAETMAEVRSAVAEWVKAANATNCLVKVAKEVVAFIIGTKGARINGISKESGASIHILDDEFVHIAGKPEAVAKGKELVEAAVREYEASHVSFVIDEALVSAVKGPRSANVMSIQRQFLVRLSVERDGRVTITGANSKSVQQAREAVEAAVEEAKLHPESVAVSERPRRETAREVNSKEEKVDARSVWEKLKSAPLLPPGAAKKPVKEEAKKDVNRLLGLNDATVGGSECYKSETGYSVSF